MNNFLVALAVLVIAVFGALFAVPQFVDWNQYRGVFEEEASRFLGRDVRVGGNVGLRLLPTPSFRLEKIIVADHEAGSGEAFFRADTLSARLSVAPLLRGVLEANEIDVIAPQIHVVPGRRTAATAPPPAARMSDRLPFAPRDLALSSVRIHDGVLVIDGADRRERFRLSGIEGELSAPALNGPYRFRGTYGADGARRDIRLTTTETDSDGSVRYKLALKHLDTGATFNLDARASDLAGAMRSDGEFTAEIPVAAFDKTAKSAADAGKSDAAPMIEVKAALTADTERMKLANLTVSVEQQGRPQLLGGEAEYSLATGQLSANLASRWLDLDKLSGLIVGTSSGKGPLVDLLALVTRTASVGGDHGASALTVAVDQATLGQEPVSGLAVTLKSSRGETEIGDFRIGLPGGSRADFNGRVSGKGDAARYAGDLSVRGTSLARLLAWATAGSFKLDPARDAPFSVRTRLDAGADAIRASEMTAEVAGTVGQGEVELGLKQRRTLAVTIEGEQVDLRPLLAAAGADAPQIRRNPILSALAAASAAGIQIDNVDSRLRLRAARLLSPDGVFSDVVADLEWLDRKLRIGQLKLDAGEGVSLDVEGTLTDLATAPKGTLRGMVTADTARGVSTLASLSAWPDATLPSEALATAIAPLRIAGTASLGDAGAIELVGDGTAAKTAVTLRSRFDRGLAQWKTAGMDLSLVLDGPDAERIANAMAGQTPQAGTGGSQPARLILRTSGAFADGLATHARLERGAANAAFSGRVVALEPLKASGNVQWSAPDGAVLQSLLGELPRLRLDGIATRGIGRFEFAAGNMTLDRIDALVDASPVTGNLTLTRAGERTTVSGALSVGSMTIAGLLRPWTEPPLRLGGTVLADAAAAANAATRVTLGGAWPATTIDLAGSRTVGNVELKARTIEITPGLALEEASMRVAWQPAKVEVMNLSGRALGGNWTGAFAIDTAAPASRLAVTVRGSKLRLEQVLADGTARPIGTGGFNLMLTANGKGSSLRDMIADLAGSGSLDLVAGAVNALSPTAVHVALETAMTGQADGMIQRLKDQLDAAMRRPAVPTELKGAKLPIEIAAGVLATKPMSIETQQGRAVASVRIDLPAATFSGQWRIERLAPLASAPIGKGPLPPLPPVTVTAAGPLGQIARLPATLDSEAIEREITVRKMERDVEELERLRKRDEERAKEEAVRGSLPPPVAPTSPLNTGGIAVPLPPPVDVTTTAGQSPTAAGAQPVAPVPAETPRARPAPPPKPKPALRPFTADEMKKVFGN